MPSPLFLRNLRLAVSTIGAIGCLEGRSGAAAPNVTTMSPFNVQAEFGVDALRLGNSASALNQHLLDEHGVIQLQDVSGIAPNLYSSNSDSHGFGDVLSLRGLANSIFFSAPSVALYVDDVPGGSVSSYPSALLNIESLVVRAGPQGTDYGRNAPGGVIDIKTRAPGAKHRGKIQVDYGSFNAVGVQAAFDGPLGGGGGYSLSLGSTARDGYIENTFLKRSTDDRRAFVGRAALHVKATDRLALRFGVLVEKVADDAPRLSSLASANPFTVASDLNGETKIDRTQYSLQARLKVDGGTVIATTSRQDWQLDPASTDLDLNPYPGGTSRVVQGEEMWTQEVRFESTPAANKAQWRAGLFFMAANTDSAAVRTFIVPPSAFVPPGFMQTERTVSAIGQTSLAAYGNVDHPLTSGTTLQFGVRAEEAKSDIDRTKASSNNFGFPVPPEPRLRDSQGRAHLSATGAIVQAVSPSLRLLVQTSLAHRPGGYSAFTANPALSRFGREGQWASEAGLTFGPPQGRFGGSLLAFWTAVDGYQFERTVPGSTDFVVVNARQVTSRGVEAKFMWNPVERLWWDFQAGYTDATFAEHRDATGTDVSGKSVPFIPRSTLRTGVTVDLGGGFAANASYAAVGRSSFDERNTAAVAQPSYGLVHAQLRYRRAHWSATLYAQNLADEKYWQFINPEIFAGSPGAPRRVGVRLSFEY